MGHTSKVFAALRTIAADIEQRAEWPPHPGTNQSPTVGVGSTKPKEGESAEFVDVICRVEDNATVSWARVGGRSAQDETFEVDIYIRCRTAGQERTDALDRLEALADVVQGLYRDPDTGVFTPPDFDDVAKLGGLTRVITNTWEEDQGWHGEAIVTFRVEARI